MGDPVLPALAQTRPIEPSTPCDRTVTDSPCAHPSGPFSVIPGYEILGELGRGGMGVVFRARQTALGRAVALKMVLHGEYASAEARRRFRTEAGVIARLQHPNIVQIFDVGEHEGHPFFSQELCPGGSLADRISRGPLSPREAARLVEVLARAAHAIHSEGIVHRDLKPANVLFGADGSPKIADFGLARGPGHEGLTQDGALLGTPAYMAPEQACGIRDAGAAVDVWALGVILYECITGHPPFTAANTLDTLRAVVALAPATPRSHNPAVGRDLEAICLKCLEKEPSARYPSADELADDLARHLRDEPVRARLPGGLALGLRWVRRRLTLVICLALLLATSLVAVGLWYRGEQHRRAAARADEQREEIRHFLEGLTSEQTQAIRRFCRWMKGRPHLSNMGFSEAFALFRQENPDAADIRAAPHAIGLGEGGSGGLAAAAASMIGD